MKMKRALAVLFAVILVSVSGLSAAEAKHVRPLELSPDSYDLNNGEFWFEAYAEDGAAGGSFTMALYLEDRYSIAEVEALMPNDTVEVNGETYTVEAVVIHGEYDSDGDGEPDIGDIAVLLIYDPAVFNCICPGSVAARLKCIDYLICIINCIFMQRHAKRRL